jgi:hypothetical protein
MTRIASLALSLVLMLGCGWAIGSLIGAASTGTLDGPARGRDVVARAAAPGRFWCAVALHLLVAASSGVVAAAVMRRALARPST